MTDVVTEGVHEVGAEGARAVTDGLNDAQAEAVAHVDGPLLVFAGAGSGKTRVITYRIANLVARHGIAPYRILAVTFTNKAAGEMRERLDHLLGHGVARDLWVGTFHATCARLLRRHHEAVGLGRDFVIYDDSDQRSLMNKVIKAKAIDDKRFPPRALLSAIHKHKQEARTPADVAKKSPLHEAVFVAFEGYEQALRASNACDFDDLLLHVLRLVERPEVAVGAESSIADVAARALRNQFSHLLVDEFQDTNAVQYRLVRALASEHASPLGGNLAVVGDDDQSIYRWRGADVRNIRNFSQDFPHATVVKLEQNYRSTKRIVHAALGVIAPSKQRIPKELWSDNEVGDKVEIRLAFDERDEAAQVAQLIDTRLRAGWSRKEMAVLYRTHAQSRVLEEELRRTRVPYRIVGGLRFFDRAEVKNLLGYLRLCSNPSSDVDLLRILNVPARGIGATTVDRLATLATERGTTLLSTIADVAAGALDGGLGGAAKKRVGVFATIIADAIGEMTAGSSPSEIATHLLERSGYEAALEAEDTDESATRLQNLYELIGSIRDFEETARAAGQIPTITGFLEQTALVNVGDDLRGGAAPDDVVTLMTVHAAKGLEFRGVMITGLEEDLFPFRSTRDEDDDLASSARGLLGEDSDAVEEERRLAYVAITRAREQLSLFTAAQRTVFGQTRYGRPSRFLRDLPSEDVVQRMPSREAVRPTGSANASSGSVPRSPFVHPMSRPAAPIEPVRAPGERYVERDEAPRDDDDAPSANGFFAGGRVKHRRFGVGEIVEVNATGSELKVVVRFPGWGTMPIVGRFLEIVA